MKLLKRAIRVNQVQQSLLLILGYNPVDVDSNQYSDMRNILDERTYREVSGCPEIPNQSVKELDVFVMFEYPVQLTQQGIMITIREEFGTHSLINTEHLAAFVGSFDVGFGFFEISEAG